MAATAAEVAGARSMTAAPAVGDCNTGWWSFRGWSGGDRDRAEFGLADDTGDGVTKGAGRQEGVRRLGDQAPGEAARTGNGHRGGDVAAGGRGRKLVGDVEDD